MYELFESMGCGIVSDVLDSLGCYNSLLSPNYKANFPFAKAWGKARTILLNPLRQGDNPDDVHNGLFLLDTLLKGDFVIVAGGSGEFAYWGELMSTAAQSKGAVGAVIDGMSRDFAPVIKMEFPVFSHGNYGRDIKNRGRVAAIDEPVLIEGIQINPGQWVFADIDGVAVIPKGIESTFLRSLKEQVKTEAKVKQSILAGHRPSDLIKVHGVF